MDKIGKYPVIRELGKGATATVYLCDDPGANRQVAVKLVEFGHDSAAMSRRLRKLFMVEKATAQRLDHPNIVKVFDAVVEEDRAYLAMEYIQGRSLEEFCSVDNMLPLHRAISIIFKCCLALDHAYRRGILHRDIKPANIMVDDNDNPKITDFGLAVYINKDMGKDSTFIMGAGSPAYMSPEQVKGYNLDQKTDIYSLGVVLFQLLTGRLPFRANNPATLMYKIVNMEAPLPSGLNPNLPTAIDPILRKALEKDLYNRYATGADFAKELSTVRYKILRDDEEPAKDNRRFRMLRQLGFFLEFDNIEIWEVLRVSVWRELSEKVVLMREGENDKSFGVLVSGLVEVSMQGRVVCRLGGGETLGEMAYLHPSNHLRNCTVVTLEPSIFLHINGSALALSSDELRDRVQQALLARLVDRVRAANKMLTQHAPFATQGVQRAPAAPAPLALTPID